MNTDKKLNPGQKVIYDGTGEKEYGIVVHSWFNEEIRAYDCYVAFFGSTFPENVPNEKPYILKYASVSLKTV